MNELCMIIKEMTKPNFLNIKTSIQSYDRDALCCGAPCWRWVYHALHSADKWFINPFVYEEPQFHEEGMDDPEKPCSVILSDEELLDYLYSIEKKHMNIWIPLLMICFMKNRNNVGIRAWNWYYDSLGICRFIQGC